MSVFHICWQGKPAYLLGEKGHQIIFLPEEKKEIVVIPGTEELLYFSPCVLEGKCDECRKKFVL